MLACFFKGVFVWCVLDCVFESIRKDHPKMLSNAMNHPKKPQNQSEFQSQVAPLSFFQLETPQQQ